MYMLTWVCAFRCCCAWLCVPGPPVGRHRYLVSSSSFSTLVFCLFVCLLGQGYSMYLWISWNLLCRSAWTQPLSPKCSQRHVPPCLAPPWFLRQCRSLNLELIHVGTLAGQQTLGNPPVSTSLVLGLQSWTTMTILNMAAAGGPNPRSPCLCGNYFTYGNIPSPS